MTWKNIYSAILDFVGAVNWDWLRYEMTDRKYNITWEDHKKIMELLRNGNYIILTHRKSHLSTYLVNISHFLLTGRKSYWSHVCMNVEGEITQGQHSVKILEAVGKGVILSDFYSVFDCDGICVLKPKMPEGINWEDVVSSALRDVGKEYDDFFKLEDGNQISCVELIYKSLKTIPDYQNKFQGLLTLIKLEKNLTPEMYYESGSFEIVLEARR